MRLRRRFRSALFAYPIGRGVMHLSLQNRLSARIQNQKRWYARESSVCFSISLVHNDGLNPRVGLVRTGKLRMCQALFDLICP